MLAENFDGHIWVYDAATEEASSVADVSGYYFAAYDGRFFFSGDNGPGPSRLWTYDAATEAALPVSNTGGSINPAYLTVYDDRLFFSAYSEAGQEVWVYDAAAAVASPAVEINPTGDSEPESFVVYDGRLFFSAEDGEHGRELWVLSPTPVANEPSSAPESVRLHTPHPNPARSKATVAFELSEIGTVRVEVFDVLGRRVALLADGPVSAGEHAVEWEPDALPSGVYLVRLTAGDTVRTRRLTLAR